MEADTAVVRGGQTMSEAGSRTWQCKHPLISILKVWKLKCSRGLGEQLRPGSVCQDWTPYGEALTWNYESKGCNGDLRILEMCPCCDGGCSLS